MNGSLNTQIRDALAASVADVATDAESVNRIVEESRRRASRRRRDRRIAVVAGAVAASAVMAVTAVPVAHHFGGAADDTAPSTQPGPSSTAPTTATGDRDWRELTGKAAGVALGLQPMTIDETNQHCPGWHAAEYADGYAFCWTDDALGLSRLEGDLLALQIQGFERTDALVEYATLNEKLDAFIRTNNHLGSPDNMTKLRDMQSRLHDLARQIGLN